MLLRRQRLGEVKWLAQYCITREVTWQHWKLVSNDFSLFFTFFFADSVGRGRHLLCQNCEQTSIDGVWKLIFQGNTWLFLYSGWCSWWMKSYCPCCTAVRCSQEGRGWPGGMETRGRAGRCRGREGTRKFPIPFPSTCPWLSHQRLGKRWGRESVTLQPGIAVFNQRNFTIAVIELRTRTSLLFAMELTLMMSSKLDIFVFLEWTSYVSAI